MPDVLRIMPACIGWRRSRGRDTVSVEVRCRPQGRPVSCVRGVVWEGARRRLGGVCERGRARQRGSGRLNWISVGISSCLAGMHGLRMAISEMPAATVNVRTQEGFWQQDGPPGALAVSEMPAVRNPCRCPAGRHVRRWQGCTGRLRSCTTTPRSTTRAAYGRSTSRCPAHKTPRGFDSDRLGSTRIDRCGEAAG